MSKFFATIEYLSGRRTAIVELTDVSGEWAGGFRVELPRAVSAGKDALYEEGFRVAEREAAVKGGRLERFKEAEETVKASPAADSSACGQCVSAPLPRRRGNVVAVEVGAPVPRCRLKLPGHWRGPGASSLRWLGSGGSPLVFGPCTPGRCPTTK